VKTAIEEKFQIYDSSQHLFHAGNTEISMQRSLKIMFIEATYMYNLTSLAATQLFHIINVCSLLVLSI
jgi:hypothetical protein